MTSRPAAPERVIPVDPELIRYWRTKPAASNEVLACDIIESLQRQNSLAQTEIKGHMRAIDDLKADLERAYQMLELHGVPRERAKSVANGIDVLATRFGKQNHFYEQALARENEAQARIAVLEEELRSLKNAPA